MELHMYQLSMAELFRYSYSLLPAKVSIQDVVDLLHSDVRVLLQEGVQLHHHARAGGEEIFDCNWMTNI